MSLASLSSQFKRLCLTTALSAHRHISTEPTLFFRATPCLMAEPLKKKRKVDPAVARAREERKKKKIEKQIKRLEKNARQLKPIQECEVPLTLLDENTQRQRGISHSVEVMEKRVLLEKKWANFKRMQLMNDLQTIDRLLFCQQKALDELRQESEDLYQEAIQFDFHLIPFTATGPVETPIIKNYNVPDGEYQDVSKIWT